MPTIDPSQEPKKSRRGRPRVHENAAARKRAYRERAMAALRRLRALDQEQARRSAPTAPRTLTDEEFAAMFGQKGGSTQ